MLAYIGGMDIQQKKLFIGELSNLTGLSQRTIRYYEELGFIVPLRSDGGFRLYSPENIELLKLIARFRDLGMSLSEIKQILSPRASVADPETIAALQKALNDRKHEFEQQLTRLSNGISEIDALLTFLSQCKGCEGNNSHSSCKNCLLERSSSDQSVKTIMTSLVGIDEFTTEAGE